MKHPFCPDTSLLDVLCKVMQNNKGTLKGPHYKNYSAEVSLCKTRSMHSEDLIIKTIVRKCYDVDYRLQFVFWEDVDLLF